MRPPTPVRDLNQRLPEMGRIRIGVKRGSGRGYPAKLDTFRFTSPDEAAIEQVSALYGGQPRPWAGQPGRFEVITQAKTISVALPPDPLGGTPLYELWSGGGCQRRCDGERCILMAGGGPDGGEPLDTDCVCAQKGVLECKLTTRLHVFLPDVKGIGTWGLVTGSWAVAEEMPAVAATIADMQEKGIHRAVMHLVQRRGPKGPVFIPVLDFAESLNQLAAGDTRMKALPAATPPGGEQVFSESVPNDTEMRSIWPAPVGGDTHTIDDDVVDAELVEDEPHMAGPPIPTPAYHEDPALVKAWAEALTTTQQNKVLRGVREAWDEDVDGTAPRSFEDIPPEVVGDLMQRGIT